MESICIRLSSILASNKNKLTQFYTICVHDQFEQENIKDELKKLTSKAAKITYLKSLILRKFSNFNFEENSAILNFIYSFKKKLTSEEDKKEKNTIQSDNNSTILY